jgi:hypothetical protein
MPTESTALFLAAAAALATPTWGSSTSMTLGACEGGPATVMRATRFSACECVRTSARARLGGCLLLANEPCSGLYCGPLSAACAAAATGLLLRLLLQT